MKCWWFCVPCSWACERRVVAACSAHAGRRDCRWKRRNTLHMRPVLHNVFRAAKFSRRHWRLLRQVSWKGHGGCSLQYCLRWCVGGRLPQAHPCISIPFLLRAVFSLTCRYTICTRSHIIILGTYFREKNKTLPDNEGVSRATGTRVSQCFNSMWYKTLQVTGITARIRIQDVPALLSNRKKKHFADTINISSSKHSLRRHGASKPRVVRGKRDLV